MVKDDQPDAREGQAGRLGVAERPVVPGKPGLPEKPDHEYHEGPHQCSDREYSDAHLDQVLIVCLRLIGFLHHSKS